MGSRKSIELRTDLSAPLPLGELRALDRGAVLRELDPVVFTWATISAVMRVYHGFDRSPTWWRRSLRGRVASRARGGAYEARVAA